MDEAGGYVPPQTMLTWVVETLREREAAKALRAGASAGAVDRAAGSGSSGEPKGKGAAQR